jgi:flavin-dependent dehydrogenase
MEALYERILTDHPQSRSMLQHATHGETRREQDYSYTSDRFAGPGYFIAGDAACFLDPLLSSGVHLAMFSGLIAAAAITSVLARDVSEEQAAAFFEKSYRRAYLRFLVFVSAFYDQNRGQRGYFWEAQRLTSRDYREDDLKKAFISLISGSEDISDAQDARGDAIIERIAGRIQENLRLRGDKSNLDPEHEAATGNARFFDAIEGLFVLSKAHAIDGMFVETGSMVRLAHV